MPEPLVGGFLGRAMSPPAEQRRWRRKERGNVEEEGWGVALACEAGSDASPWEAMLQVVRDSQGVSLSVLRVMGMGVVLTLETVWSRTEAGGVTQLLTGK